MSSENWGALGADPAYRTIEAGPDDSPESARAPEAGAWPEEMDDIRYYADSSLTIPGKSTSPSACGEWGYREFCDTCGEAYAAPHRCQQRKCPDCYLTWRGNDAASVTERLAAARRDAEGADARLTHSVYSPPPGSITSLVDYWGGFQEAYALAQEKGIHGGVAFAHGWRVKDGVKAAYRELTDADVISEAGVWEFVREHEKDWRTLTYWSPHYHILGLGAEIGENKPDEQDGWVFKRISHQRDSSFPKFDLYDETTYEPMFGATMYLLSHVGFQADEQKQVVRWFGSLSYNQFSIGDLEGWEESVIQRMTEQVAGYDLDEDGGLSSARECEVDQCDGRLVRIWDAGSYLTDREWCQQIGRDQERRLATAFELAIGDVKPPPGMKHPDSEQHLEEVLDLLMRRPNG